MNPFLMKLLAVLFVVIFVGKRAITGPQQTFARVSVFFEVVGISTLAAATQKDDLSANIGAVFMVMGLLVAIGMVAVDCVHTVRTGISKQNT
ncbi:MAG: hypothetical protein V4713_03945 [Pseudomonadota bacterium]